MKNVISIEKIREEKNLKEVREKSKEVDLLKEVYRHQGNEVSRTLKRIYDDVVELLKEKYNCKNLRVYPIKKGYYEQFYEMCEIALDNWEDDGENVLYDKFVLAYQSHILSKFYGGLLGKTWNKGHTYSSLHDELCDIIEELGEEEDNAIDDFYNIIEMQED